jgi:hypothetical protein
MPDAQGERPTLGAIRAVTHTVPNLESIEQAYTRCFGYRAVDRGSVPAAVAHAWRAPAVAGRAYLTLEPESGEAVHLRFVESPAAAGWHALTTHGWNATELVVQDLDALAARLGRSVDFRLIGAPRSLTRFPTIRAMQVLGPAGECLYLTQIGAGTTLELAVARSFVGRVFVVVAGGSDLEAMFAVYAGFANAIDPAVATPVAVISQANGLPVETLHRHGLVKLPGGSLIELDAYPAVTQPRATPPGELPPGLAIVTFACDGLRRCARAAPVAAGLLRGVGVGAMLKGAAGELIELVEADES